MSARASLRAIVLGYLTDMFTTQVFVLALTLVLLDKGSAAIAPIDRLNPNLLDSFEMIWGLFFTCLGGFVAARLAPASKLAHAAAAGFLSLLTCAMLCDTPAAGPTTELFQLGMLLTVPAALLGGRAASLWSET